MPSSYKTKLVFFFFFWNSGQAAVQAFVIYYSENENTEHMVLYCEFVS
jgi:hypothetical protein